MKRCSPRWKPRASGRCWPSASRSRRSSCTARRPSSAPRCGSRTAGRRSTGWPRPRRSSGTRRSPPAPSRSWPGTSTRATPRGSINRVGGPEMAPHTPHRSARPGKARARLDDARGHEVSMWRIGIDVGGTFTDLAAVDETGRVVIAKCASTPRDQSEGLVEGLGLLAAECGTDLDGLLARTERIVHGTTVATNALLERKGAKVGLLTTEGHRDIIEMREGLKDDRYNVRMPPPVPLVPRALRLGVRERVAFDGRVTTPLAARSLDAALTALARAGVDAVAVCYLHAYRNGRHEA